MILIAQQIDQTKHLQNSKRAIEPRIKERKKNEKKNKFKSKGVCTSDARFALTTLTIIIVRK